jgi:ATP-dependent protease ClpP protease subunit
MPNISSLNRRQIILGLGAVALPAVALADDDDAAPTPFIARPIIPAPDLAKSAPASPLASAAPANAKPNAADETKAYFVFFQRSIDVASAKALRDQLVSLIEKGVTEITLVINSAGGVLAPSLQLYSLIRSLPANIKTHGQGFVASAANILMLAGNHRTADNETRFLFHSAQGPIVGTLNTPQFDEQLLILREFEDMLKQIYKERTRIPDSDIDHFKYGTISYNAAKALQYGIIQKIGALEIPRQKSKLIFVD